MFTQNVIDAINSQKSSNATTLLVSFAQFKPTKIIEDSAKRFHAIYEDPQGSYDFKIVRKKRAFIVISDGITCCKSKDVDFIKWNFETQLANVSPRVFKRSQ